MNTEKALTVLPPEFTEANYQFHEKFIYSRSLWLAIGCAAGALAVGGYNRWCRRKEEQFTQEAEQFFEDEAKRNAA